MPIHTKIFQIGFNVTESLSLHYYLVNNGINSIFGDNGNLAITMTNNCLAGVNPLAGYESYDAFFDMEAIDSSGNFIYAYQTCLGQIYNRYPDALYVFNIQNVKNWIEKRASLYGYLPAAIKFFNCTENDVLDIWKNNYEEYVEYALKMFSGKKNFLLYDIDECNIETVNSFFGSHGIALNSNLYKSYSEIRGSTDISVHVKGIREAALFFRYHKNDLNTAIELLEIAQQQRPCSSYFKDELAVWNQLKNRVENKVNAE
jgi:hypothetical protein